MMTEEPSLVNNAHIDPLLNPKKISISTRYGYIVVTQQGPVDRPAIVTYHDVGHNSNSQYHQFFGISEMMPITSRFSVYHINAPGQEDRATSLPAAHHYPTPDQLADSVHDVFEFLGIKAAVCLGIGLGANIFVRFALAYPSKVSGLVLINCVIRSAGFLEGFSLKWPHIDDAQTAWTSSLLSYVIHHQFGPESQSRNPELVEILRDHLENNMNVRNATKLLQIYLKRNHIHLAHGGKSSDSSRVLQCRVLHLTGCYSPHKKDVIETNDHCDSSSSTYVEFADCGGAVLDEQPAKAADSIRLFLQGLGYVSHLSIPQYSVSNRLAEQVNEYKKQHGAYSKVPRRLSVHLVTDEQMMLTNPIEDAEDF